MLGLSCMQTGKSARFCKSGREPCHPAVTPRPAVTWVILRCSGVYTVGQPLAPGAAWTRGAFGLVGGSPAMAGRLRRPPASRAGSRAGASWAGSSA